MLLTLLALLPLAWLLTALGILKIPAHLAGLAALALAIPAALFTFSMQPRLAAESVLEGAALTLFPIIWVVLSAVFMYQVSVSTGAMAVIRRSISGISEDRRVQALFLAFCFGGFLEAMAGFGTAVAIPAGIMVAAGFNPMLAASACLIANTVPVAFGVLGIPVITLSQVTGLALDKLALYTALQLFPFAALLPLLLMAYVAGSIKRVKGVIGISIATGLAFAAGQLLSVLFISVELAAAVGSLLSAAVAFAWIRMRPVKDPWRFGPQDVPPQAGFGEDKITLSKALKAWSPFLTVLVIVLAIKYLPVQDVLSRPPFTLTAQIYTGSGGRPQTFALASSGGTALFLSAIIGGLIQGASLKEISKAFLLTVRLMWRSAATILCVVILAKLMGYSGMISHIAGLITSAAGPLYPLISPMIGALGTFLTGSDTSSNILFGDLQKQSAIQSGISPAWLAAANASGATAGKMISPQSISIAASSVGLQGKEGVLLRKTLFLCLAYAAMIGVLVWIFSWFIYIN